MVLSETTPEDKLIQFRSDSSVSINSNVIKNISYGGLNDKTNGSTNSSINEFCKVFLKSKDHSMLGKGSFGRVVSGNIFDKRVAIKICPQSSCQCSGESNALHINNENVVTVYHIIKLNPNEINSVVINYILSAGLPLNSFKVFGAQIIVMEFGGRQTLQQLLDDSQQHISEERRNHIISQIANGMHHCHKVNVIHMDIKPANVMILSGDVCKLIDFGSSKRIGSTHKCCNQFKSGDRTAIATVMYCAPEIFLNKLMTPLVDIYSFGITMWQMITRTVPYNYCEPHSVIYRVVSRKLRPSLKSIHYMDPNYMNLMVKCWSEEPKDRPNSEQLCKTIDQLIK